jgi:hypothetical protein
MTHRFDLYGSTADSTDEVRAALEALLGVRFVPHQSDFRGDYFKTADPTEEISIQRHQPDDEGYLDEPDFAAWPILVHVGPSPRWDELDCLLLSGPLTRLRTEEL